MERERNYKFFSVGSVLYLHWEKRTATGEYGVVESEDTLPLPEQPLRCGMLWLEGWPCFSWFNRGWSDLVWLVSQNLLYLLRKALYLMGNKKRVSRCAKRKLSWAKPNYWLVTGGLIKVLMSQGKINGPSRHSIRYPNVCRLGKSLAILEEYMGQHPPARCWRVMGHRWSKPHFQA